MLRKKWNVCKLLLALEIFLVLILLPGCFRKEETALSFLGEEIELTAMEEGYAVFCGAQETLTPGVYQIRVWTSLGEGQSISVEMKSDDMDGRSVRSNSVAFSSDSVYQDFEVYVVHEVQTAYVQCGFYNTGAEGLIRLEIQKSSMGNRILLFGMIVIFGAIDLLVCFYRGIRSGKIVKRRQIVVWVLAAGVFLVSLPYCTDYIFIGEDSVRCWAHISYLADAMRQGRASHTSLFHYIPAFFHMLGFPVVDAYKMFLFLFWTAEALIAYFAFKRCVKDEYAALCGSMLYLLTPPQIVNIYKQGTAEGCLAMVFLPLVCCGLWLLYNEDSKAETYRRYKWYIVAGMSGILLSRLSAGAITAGMAVLCCGIFWKKTFRRETGRQLLEAAGITVLINAWYWIPAIYLSGRVSVSVGQPLFPWGAAAVALAGAFLFRRVMERRSETGRMLLGIVLAVLFVTVTYCINDIIIEGEPIWLYNVENIGTVGKIMEEYLAAETAGREMNLCRIVTALVSGAGAMILSGICFYRKRKDGRNEK